MHDELVRPSVAGDVEAADDGGRDAGELPHHELRSGGDLVGDGDDRRWSTWPTGSVWPRRSTSGAIPAQPIATSTMPFRKGRPNESLITTPTSRPVRSARPRADARGRRVGIDRQEHERARLGRVRRVDARRGADEAVPRLRDHERRPRPDDRGRLGEDHLEAASVVSGRELARALRRLDVVEPNDAALRLRDGLLRDDDDVAVLERHALGDQRRRGRLPRRSRGGPSTGMHAELRHRRGPSRRARAGPPRRASACR